MSKTMLSFGIFWTFIAFAYSATFGATSKIIRATFPSNVWAEKIGTVALSSRLGSMLATILFGHLLRIKYQVGSFNNWQTIFLVTALFQALIVVVNAMFLTGLDSGSSSIATTVVDAVATPSDKVPNVSTSEETVSLGTLLKSLAVLPKFWHMLIAKMFLMLPAKFISFIPLYLVTGWGYSKNDASTYSSVFALGSLLATSAGAKVYQRLDSKNKVHAIAASNVLSIVSAGLLLFHMYTPVFHPMACLLLLFAWGAAWSLPFYIPSGIMAFELGGKHHAATVTNIFDVMGTAAAAVFSIPLVQYGKVGQWRGIFGLLTAGQMVALITMYFAMYTGADIK